MQNRMLWGWLAVAVVAMLPGTGQCEDSYSGWKKNVSKNRYECAFNYEAKDGKKATQTVLVYGKESPRVGWAYFVNNDGKAWARCAVKGNPKYNPRVMYWQKLKADGEGYEDYKMGAGYCPAPADGKKAIPVIPDPPI